MFLQQPTPRRIATKPGPRTRAVECYDQKVARHYWVWQPVVMKSDGNATRTFDKFSAAVRTAIVHLLSTVNAKGAFKTTNHGLARFRQVSRTLLAYIAHL